MEVELFVTRVNRNFILLGAQGKRGNIPFLWEEDASEDGVARIDDGATQDVD